MRPATAKRVARVEPVGDAWAGHSVGFAYHVDGGEFVAYYGPERRLRVAGRRDAGSPGTPGGEWEEVVLDERVGWDSHNDLALTTDSRGCLHLSGNVHNDPLVYFRSEAPRDVRTLERVGSLVGEDEDSTTYPRFIDGPGDELVYMYRDGGSGDGRRLLNAYDPDTGEWRRLLDSPLLDGRGEMNAYPQGPIRGPNGDYHLAWVWRDTPDAATNHDVSYARSPDLQKWERADGTSIELPITADDGAVVDPIPPNAGLINSNLELGFDGEGNPVLSYHAFGDEGNTQAYNARFDGERWTRTRASDWDYRWAFGGRGSLDEAIDLDPVRPCADGLVQTFRHAEYGAGRWVLDPETLEPMEREVPWHGLPAGAREPAGDAAGVRVQWTVPERAPADPERALRWEALPPNRDEAREEAPPASDFSVYYFE